MVAEPIELAEAKTVTVERLSVSVDSASSSDKTEAEGAVVW